MPQPKAPSSQQLSWPVDPETGEPMAIVTVSFGEHIGSGMGIPDFCGIDIGPVGALIPCRNDKQSIFAAEEQMLRLTQFVVGSNRRDIMNRIDPTTKQDQLGSVESFEEAVRVTGGEE